MTNIFSMDLAHFVGTLSFNDLVVIVQRRESFSDAILYEARDSKCMVEFLPSRCTESSK